MEKKTVPVDDHKRSKPGDKPWAGPGNKPGPKTVDVEDHKRSKPEK